MAHIYATMGWHLMAHTCTKFQKFKESTYCHKLSFCPKAIQQCVWYTKTELKNTYWMVPAFYMHLKTLFDLVNIKIKTQKDGLTSTHF